MIYFHYTGLVATTDGNFKSYSNLNLILPNYSQIYLTYSEPNRLANSNIKLT